MNHSFPPFQLPTMSEIAKAYYKEQGFEVTEDADGTLIKFKAEVPDGEIIHATIPESHRPRNWQSVERAIAAEEAM